MLFLCLMPFPFMRLLPYPCSCMNAFVAGSAMGQGQNLPASYLPPRNSHRWCCSVVKGGAVDLPQLADKLRWKQMFEPSLGELTR